MISVILVTYNSMSVLPDCLASLEINPIASELEVVVADNASSDGTLRWLMEYQKSHSFLFASFQLLELKRNTGYAYANNRAIEQARGDMVLLLNPDTVVGSDAIVSCKEVLERDKQIGAIGCRLILRDGSLDRACKRSFPTLWNSFSRLSGLSLLFPRSRWLASYNLTYLDETKCYDVDCVSGAFMMVPASVISIVGALDEEFFMYGEDIDWCYRIKDAGYRVWYEGAATTLHLKGGNGGKSTTTSLLYFYGTMGMYYRKRHPTQLGFWGWTGLRIILAVVYIGHRMLASLRNNKRTPM
ncbi:glycosyltransferase family 2 protein [Alicyclobacillus ferrooxydans]|uniref:Glycosyltransferase 2-like domain-containing protein n=1 Tax=Alicyclobacillus ferrooxydans TaxID=471514 RepID=A0A0P9CHC6_9BACL|nr:glycosyltransferase family 2 protein [Alicyclobacillus ferrooxydans]KPV42450.1 hypothetical protein AN477_17845 [Alicyclobacillus ferrooxydans]